MVDDEDVGGAPVDEGIGKLARLGADDESAERDALAAIGGGVSVERGGGERSRAISSRGMVHSVHPAIIPSRSAACSALCASLSTSPGVAAAAETNEAGRRENRERANARATGAGGAKTRRDDKPPTTDIARMAWGTPEKIAMDMDALRVGAGRKPIRRTRRGRVRGRARVCASRERAEKRDTRSPPTETVPDDTSELTKLRRGT